MVRVHACAGYAEAGVLRLAAAAEQRQSHPIAQAILAAAAERKLDLPTLDEAHYELGFGLSAWLQGRRVRVGSERFLALENLSLPRAAAGARRSARTGPCPGVCGGGR